MKYIKLGLLLLLLLAVLIPAYRYFGSVDWDKKHSSKIAALDIVMPSANTGLFRLPAGDFEYFVRVAGLQNEGPAVVLLHGFPESSIMWSDLLESANKEGYRVLAFDQRGYSPGARPNGIENYHIDKLTTDVFDVADQIGFDTFHLVGHDWGAVVAWNAALKNVDRLHSVTALSIPHIGVFFDAVQHHPEQQKRSSYIKLLQTPILPEYKLVANHQAYYKKMMAKNRKEYLAEYVALYAEHGAATATLNWYRALKVEDVAKDKSYLKPIQCPTLFIWGTEDGVIAPSVIPTQEKWIDAPYREVSLETGHGLIQSKPDTVIAEILAHFEKNSN